MERIEAFDGPEIRYAGVIHRLKELDKAHLNLQMSFHCGSITEERFLSSYRLIMRRREMQIIKAAVVAIDSGDIKARSAAYDVVTSVANEGRVRLTTQIAFLRTSGIRPLLSHFK